jgi:NADPH:quinone reductase
MAGRTATAEMERRAADVPTSMRAAAIDRFGGPDALKMQTLPVPSVDQDEVLVAVHTAGVGGWDADMRSGWLPDGTRPRFPLVLGTDGSGHVAAIGSRVRRFAIGDVVYGFTFNSSKGGFYAEYVAVTAANVGRPPSTLTMREAGAMAATGLTALQGIDDVLHVKRGETVVVHGASGGVGSLALQFAKARGARVLATASGRDGLALVRRLGADAVADGRKDDLHAAAVRFAPDGIDAVLALAGGDPLERLLGAVRRGGRVACPNGVEPEPPKRRGVKVESYDATPGVREFERLGKAVEAATLQVAIAASFSLDEAAEAHKRLAAGHVVGKVVLRVEGR